MLRLLLPLLLLTACGKQIEPLPKAGDVHHIPAVEVRFVDREMLLAVYRASGKSISKEQKLEGFVGKRGDQWVIYSLPPQRVDDAATLTLGHELLHIPLGEYH